jgi:hypothetical protein
MSTTSEVLDEVPGLYRVVPLGLLRRTEGVDFHFVPLDALDRISAIDRLIHRPGAYSPGTVGDVERPWYYHQAQGDHLIVLQGTREVELYTREHGRVEEFLVTPDRIDHNGELVCDGPGMLTWPVRVFHRVVSSAEIGSASVNFAAHYKGFDIRTNFSIYDLDTATGEYRVIRAGHLDQPGTPTP